MSRYSENSVRYHVHLCWYAKLFYGNGNGDRLWLLSLKQLLPNRGTPDAAEIQ